jgi:hypothetical protein
MDILMNKYQTQITDELLSGLPQEVQDQLLDIINNVEFVKRLISPARQYAKDRPRDSQGRIIVDLVNPHILEDMDYFRPTALHYKKYGCFTSLRPNANPNSEYGKWIRQERDRCWNGYVRESDGEWITGPLYFYMNYCPIVQSKIRKGTKQADRIVDFPEMWEGIYWRFHYMEQARSGGLYNDFLGGNHGAELASRGKAFAYSQDVETPKGRRKWADINVGDTLFAPDGTTTKVVNIPFDEEHDVYKMTLIDGRVIFTTLEHLWKINKNGENWNKLYSTKEILDSKHVNRFAIEVSKGVDYEYKEIPIQPYLLGLMLGDGSFTISKYNQAQFTSREEDVLVYSNLLHIPFKRVGNTKMQWLIDYPEFGKKAKELNLHDKVSDTKFIPDCYKYNSKEVRKQVLLGLFDTDGTVHDSGKPELCTTSKQLAEDVCWIARSLGYNASYWIKFPKYMYEGEQRVGKTCYIVYVYTNDCLFNLPRKIKLCGKRGIRLDSRVCKTSIKSIEYSHRERCKCVTVDREDGLFLIGDFLTTHNSKSYSMASILTHNFVLGENSTACEEIVSIATAYQKEYLTKDGVLNKFVSMANFCAEHTQFPRKRLKSSLQDMVWKMGYKDLELDIEKGTQNSVLGVSSKDDESKLRGKRAAFIGIEEFGCHIKGTKVLMYNGSIKNVEDIVVGDILMGDDNTPRIVQELYNGTDQLYKITLSNGDYQIVNSHHPVYFKKYNWNNGTYTEHTLTAPELLEIKNLDKGYYIPKAIIHFPYTPVAINPYFLGLWLGDGDSTRLDIANEDAEVLSWLSDNYEGTIRNLSQSNSCKVFHISKSTHVYNRLFSEYDLYNNKHIPQDYKVNAPEVQLQVIAGLIDTDGTYNSKKNFFEITQRYDRKHILDDMKFMCECNGLKCSMTSRVGTGKKKGILHYRLRISGDLSIIPTKISRKKSIRAMSYKSRKCWNDYTFRVEPYKVDEYYGFTVDKNHLFVLGDLTITHNTFPRLIDLYNVMLPSVQEGDYVFGLMYLQGTAGDNESDFAGAQEIMYSPRGYNIYALPNVYDKNNQGKRYFVFFFPGYINRKGCYNKDGVSNVVQALIEILMNRYRVKYNSTDPNTVIKTIAEVPITPAEAIVKTGVNMFPVTDLTERLGQLDANPREYDDVYVGDLTINSSKEVEFKPTSDQPIREFPHKDNKIEGAIEIYKLPEKDRSGRVFDNRYILGCDPYDDDESNTMSLGSVYVLDLWTDKIVAEYTGRPLFADDFYEICRKMCLFYNGRMNYENNKKGLFAYFSKMNCLYLLTDVLDFLKDKDMVKGSSYGNKAKGTNATAAINAYARNLLRSWLLRPVSVIQTIDGEDQEVMIPNLYTLRSRALIKELILYNSEGNFDRISSMGMLMLLREDKMILYKGEVSKSKEEDASASYLGNDPFFKTNYDARFKQ